MKKILTVAIFIVIYFNQYAASVDFINPIIGTDGLGHTTPSATTPFGMVQLGPSMDVSPWDWKRCSGYHYSDRFIKGFAHNHISGAGLSALGDILIMPMTGSLKTNPGTFETHDKGYMSQFLHSEEETSAGYYKVRLADYDINVELTATPRTGFHRYTINKSDSMYIIIDPIHGIGEFNLNGSVEFISDREIKGWKQTSGLGGNRKTYFFIKFSKPFLFSGTVANGVCLKNNKSIEGNTAKGYVCFKMKKNENVEFSVAISHVDYEGAIANYNVEAKGKSFDKVHKEARKMWQEKCNKFRIEGSDIEKRIFYTAVYHSFFSPNIISDVNGNYCINNKKRRSEIVQYSNYSTWDTYRAQNPLLTIVEQNGVRDFVNSLTSRRVEIGSYLPVWECIGNDNCCMLGRSPVAIMAEAIIKDIPGIDVENAYISMKESLLAVDRSDWWYNSEKSGMIEYLKYNFIPAEIGTSVAKTMEFNYYDYAVSEVAKKLDKIEDAKSFYKRSLGHRNLWNPNKGFFWPRTEDGSWKELDITNWEDLGKSYVSGNIWGYSSYTPHDMKYMISKLGGNKEYVRWLDEIFCDTTQIKGIQNLDISGFIGKYGHGDEPSHQMPYLYTLANAPHKTQEIVHRICKEMYDDSPNGLINNDDLGQMSSWYIFSTLGFYPVNPASGEYVLGTPMFKNASLSFENGKTFSIKTRNWRPNNPLVEKVLFNGSEILNGIIKHEDIMKGGELLFIMKK